MSPLPKFLIALGIALILIGLLWHGKFLPLGKLPGDLVVEKKNLRFYFPLATCILVSVLLSLILYLFNQFRK